MIRGIALRNRAGKPAHILVVLMSFRLVFLATFKISYVDFWLWNYLDFWTLNYVVFGTSKFCPFIWVYRYCIYFWITRTLIFHHVVPNLHFVTYFWYCHCHLLMLISKIIEIETNYFTHGYAESFTLAIASDPENRTRVEILLYLARTDPNCIFTG